MFNLKSSRIYIKKYGGGGGGMKVNYDPEADILYTVIKESTKGTL